MNFRISNSLFESIRNVTNPQVEEPAKVEEAEVDKAHFCATHVEHAMLGLGTCISEQHAEPDEQGQIAWYTVEFPTGTHRIQTSNLRVVEGKSHSHSKKMAESEQIDELSVNTLNRVHSAAVRDANDATRDGDEEKANKRYDLAGKASNKAELKNRAAGLKPSGQHSMEEELDEKKLHPNQQVLDVHEPEKDELTSKDFEMLRAGKKQKAVKEAAFDPMKHIDKKNQNPAIKAAAKDVDRSDYGARAALMKAGGVKDDRGPRGVTQEASSSGPGSAFDWRNTPRETLKPGERAGFDSKKISTGTVYTKKFTKEKPEPAGKAFKPKAVKEGISQTIINYDDFRIDVTDNPTYGDYLRALQTMVESRDESIQQEVVAIATAAYDEKINSIIIESKARQLFAGKLDEIRKSGSTVLDESYIVESNSTYVEYTVEKDGVRTQYVHIGTNGNK
jgi:hypothetical protein